MTALAESFPREVKGRNGLKCLNVRGGVALTIYKGSAVAHRIGSQMGEVPDASAQRNDLIFVGWAKNEVTITTAVDTGGGGWAVDADNNPITVDVESGIGTGLDTGTSTNAVTIDDLDRIVFGYDSNTAWRTDNNGQLSPLGRLVNVLADGTLQVDVADDPWAWTLGGPPADSPPTTFTVRNVITALGAYTASAGTITVTATGALAAEDGITDVAGDEVWLPEYTGTANSSVTVAAADSGPYEVINPGTTGVSAVLRRPRWWAHGAPMPLGASVRIAEGTLFGRSVWEIGAAKGAIIGTTDPAAYPDEVIQQVTLTSSTVTVTNVPIRTGKHAITANLATAGGTLTSTVGYGPIVDPTPGPIGTASLVIDAIASGQTKNGTSDTSTLNLSIRNG